MPRSRPLGTRTSLPTSTMPFHYGDRVCWVLIDFQIQGYVEAELQDMNVFPISVSPLSPEYGELILSTGYK